MRVDVTELNAKAKRLEGAELSQVVHDLKGRSLKLTFKHWDGSTLIARCTSVIYCNLSADGLESSSEVICASVQEVQGDILKYLETCGYLWNLNQSEGNPLEGNWLHISLDGETSLAIICNEVVFSAS